MDNLTILIFVTTMMSVSSLRCVNTIKKGPYTVNVPNINIVVPYKFLANITRTEANMGNDTVNNITTVELILPCYKEGNYKRTACYDQQLGNYIEFKTKTICFKSLCYFLKIATGGIVNESYMNLTETNMENLKAVIMAEHALNEDLRINFGLAVKELTHTRKILIKTILSMAKIDDNLLGAIMNNQARSQFVNEDTFYLIPCGKIGKYNSSCKMNMIFKTGRWDFKTNLTTCSNVKETQSIDISQFLNLSKENSQLDKSQDNFDGWTYFINQQNILKGKEIVIQNKQQMLYEETREIKESIKKVVLGVIFFLLMGFVMLSCWITHLQKKIEKMKATARSGYLRRTIMEPKPTCIITNEPVELERILHQHKTNMGSRNKSSV